MKRLKVFSQELGQSLLVEELLENDVRVEGIKLSDLFGELERLYPLDNKQWNELAKQLGFESGVKAEYFCWRVLPEVLRKDYPKLLEALFLAAGEQYHKEGGEAVTRYTKIPQKQRTMLIEAFWEDLSNIMQGLDLYEVAVEFTGDPRSLVLLHMVKRYFRGRLVLPTIFMADPTDRALLQYMERIRARFGLDPIDAYDKVIDPCALEDLEIVLVAGKSCLADVYAQAEIRTKPILAEWDRDAILSYIEMENLMVYEGKPQIEEWTRDKGGRYHHKGKIIATAEVPPEVKEALEEVKG